LLTAFLLSALPVAYIIHKETAARDTHAFEYRARGWFRECAKWDAPNRRFVVSFFEGGVGVVPVSDGDGDAAGSEEALEEIPVVVNDAGLGKNSSLGLAIDAPRNRVLVAIADVLGNKYGAVAAYDLTTWNRLFLTRLAGVEDEKSFADDVAVDGDGNGYITDAKGNKIWKIGADGELLDTIRNPLFAAAEWYRNLVGLNGIVFHPNGYLLVIHTFTGNLFKVDVGDGHRVKLVGGVSGGPLRFGDGLELLSPTRLVVAGNPSRLVETSDDWETGSVLGKFAGASHRIVTAATVKDGKVYLNHILGLGYPNKKHLLVEAVF
ncbi:hypothetical protein M569_17129, partial [Genlisea aurea]